MVSFSIRSATETDLPAIKKIADANKTALGFLPWSRISEAIQQERVLLLEAEYEVAGFVIYRHRKTDRQTTLSDICVTEKWQGGKGGHTLVHALVQDCRERDREFILLKCPIDLPANRFYEKTGFTRVGVDNGKHRPLNIWRLEINNSETA